MISLFYLPFNRFYFHSSMMLLFRFIDLERVGKPLDAFQLLASCLTQKRNVRTWSQQLEDAIMKFIELAVRLKTKTHELKSVLLTYKGSTATSPALLVKAIRYLLDLTEKAVGTSLATAMENEDDFEDDTPEALAAYAFNDVSEDTKRKDRQRQNPASRFLWESFRIVLDILKNNLKFQDLYHDVIRNIFAICLRYKRKNEFRRFTTFIREHVATFTALSQVPTSVAPGEIDYISDAQRLFLKTRLDQLNTASGLELWSETFSTIEDIHELLRFSTSPVSAYPTLLHIYDKLAAFYWNSTNYLFNAYTVMQLHRLMLEAPDALEIARKDASETSLLMAEPTDLLSHVVLSALLVVGNHDEEDQDGLFVITSDPNLRLASLLGLPAGVRPSRAHLMATIESLHLLPKVTVETRTLYKLLEKPSSPLTIKKSVLPALNKLKDNKFLAAVVPSMSDLIVTRVLQRLGQVYTIVTMEHFASLVPDMPWTSIEKLILKAINNNIVRVRIDHNEKALNFSSASLESPALCQQLSKLSRSLTTIIDTISSETTAEREAERASIFSIVRSGLEEEHRKVAERMLEIKQRKAQEEQAALEKEFARKSAQEAEIQRKREEEEAALREAVERREQEERQRDEEQRELQKKQLMAEAIAKSMAEVPQHLQTSKAAKKAATLASKLTEASQEELIEASRKLEAQKKADKERRLTDERKNLDYFVRACRIVERDVREKNEAVLETEAKEQHNAAIQEFLAKHKQKYEHAYAEKQRLSRIVSHRDAFAAKLIAERKAKYEEEKAAYEAKKAAYLAEEAQRQEEKRRAEEERRRQEEEAEAARRAEEERAALERQKRIQEEKERRAKDEELLKMRLEKEAEMERRDKEARQAARGAPTSSNAYVPKHKRVNQ